MTEKYVLLVMPERIHDRQFHYWDWGYQDTIGNSISSNFLSLREVEGTELEARMALIRLVTTLQINLSYDENLSASIGIEGIKTLERDVGPKYVVPSGKRNAGFLWHEGRRIFGIAETPLYEEIIRKITEDRIEEMNITPAEREEVEKVLFKSNFEEGVSREELEKIILDNPERFLYYKKNKR